MCVLFALALVAGEMPYDGIDQDGDGVDLVDVDGDGFPSELVGGGDCNDRDPRVHPDACDSERDGIDLDCDGADGEDPPDTWLSAARRAFERAVAAWRRFGG
ncbi:MAG: hypothetical protein EP330_09465 [Deltaproteobacteria bacterium]|nr:MAG: hypothetical protein EP330_09465 [Deltaproteobacteria bacterium]